LVGVSLLSNVNDGDVFCLQGADGSMAFIARLYGFYVIIIKPQSLAFEIEQAQQVVPAEL